MAALEFPDSPSNGDTYAGYTYNSTVGAWQWDTVSPTLESLTDTDITSPSSGEVLTYDGTDWVNQAASGGVTRNLLYNGAMQVAQRGTSETSITTSGYYTADRWRLGVGSLGTWTQTIESDGPTGSGFTKSYKLECTTADAAPAASDSLSLEHRLEGQDLQGIKKGTSDAESITLSFWVKSNATGTYVVALKDDDNSRYIAASYTISSSGTWEKKAITFAGDTSGVFDNDNNLSLFVRWWLAVGSDFSSGTLQTSWGSEVAANRAVGQTNLAASTSNYWQVTGVQLETGTAASDFEHKSYGVELAECQRYYIDVESTNQAISAGYMVSSTEARVLVPTPVTMRANPTASSFDDVRSNGSTFVPSAIAASQVNPNGIRLRLTISGASTNQTCVEVDGGQLDAEL